MIPPNKFLKEVKILSNDEPSLEGKALHSYNSILQSRE